MTDARWRAASLSPARNSSLPSAAAIVDAMSVGRPRPIPSKALVEVIESLGLSRGARILLVGHPSEEVELLLRGIADLVCRGSEVDSIVDPAMRFDAAIAVEGLEAERWDRWELQRAHRVLRPDGWLLLMVPNFLDVWTPSGLGFLAGRVLREARRTLRPGVNGPAFSGRRYRPSVLRAMLEDLGFECVEWKSLGGRMFDLMKSLTPRLDSTGSAHFVVARRRSSLWGLDSHRPFPDPESHQKTFERAQASVVRMRESWSERHQAVAGPPARPFEPARYRGANVLVLAPHPDDEVIGCGGTIRLLHRAGARVTILHATDGSDSAALQNATEGDRTTVRIEEATEVGRALGVELEFWRADNRAFRADPRWSDAMTTLLSRTNPALVFTPFTIDVHPDHWTLTRILASALPRTGLDLDSIEIFNYEVWSLVPANWVTDVTAVVDEIERLLLLYATALKVDDYVHMGAARLLYNSLRYLGRAGYAEAFLGTSGSAYLDMFRSQEIDPVLPNVH